MKTNTLFILFETDIYLSKRSRIFLGVFTSKELAEIKAKKNRCNTFFSSHEILEVETNTFYDFTNFDKSLTKPNLKLWKI